MNNYKPSTGNEAPIFEGAGNISQQLAMDNAVRNMAEDLGKIAKDLPDWAEAQLKKGFFDDLDPNITRPDFRLRMNGVEIAPSGDLIAVSGKPGTGKSTIIAIIAGILLSGGSWGGFECCTPVRRVLWIDTEKGEYSCKMKAGYFREAGKFGRGTELTDLGVDFARLRGMETDHVAQMVKIYASLKTYDLIILDGIIDMMRDKSSDDTTDVTDLLKSLCSGRASVIAMLHGNKGKEDDNMRYAIGTELWRLCTTWLIVRYDKNEDRHEVELMKSNDSGRADNVYFKFDKDGRPQPMVIDGRQLVLAVMRDGKARDWTKLKNEIADKFKIPVNTAFNYCHQASESKIIIQDEKGKMILNPTFTKL